MKQAKIPTAQQRIPPGRPDSHRALVLLSGGIDSSTCVAFYQEQGFEVESLFVDYGQPASKYERTAAVSTSEHFHVRLHEVKVRGVITARSGFVPGRNALLVATALSCVALDSGLIALGIHAGVSYPDCEPGFLTACQGLADIYHSGAVRLVAPFVNWTKADIITAAKSFKFPLDQTYSCEAGRPSGCGVCLSCLDRARLLP